MGIPNCFSAKERWLSTVLYKLNEVALKDVYPIPRIDDALDTLAG